MSETANLNTGAAAGASAPVTAPVARETIKRPVKAVDVYLDETKDYSTVHGERTPGDPDLLVCFFQFGLPFDAQKKLIRDHRAVVGNEKAAKAIEKMEARARKLLERKAAKEADEDIEDDDDDTEDDGDGAIDLKAWAMGKKYRWQLVSDAMVLKFSKRITSKRDALETLITEGVVQPGQLSAENKRALNAL